MSRKRQRPLRERADEAAKAALAAQHLAVVASIRPRHTNYYEVLMACADRALARAPVRDQFEDILDAWGRSEEEPS
jgi:hypothetical protein